MMRVGILLAIALLSSIASSGQQWPKEMTFPSGRKVKIVYITQIHIKDYSGRLGDALLLEYETKQKITDRVGLQKEVDEIWAWLKVDAEHRKLREALMEVVEPPPIHRRQNTQFTFKQQSDGSWQQQKVEGK
jgi:hypothetical protein